MKRSAILARSRGVLRADLIHADPEAAIGLATLERGPLAFHSPADRAAILGFACGLASHLPRALTLTEAAAYLSTFPEVLS